MLLILLKGNPMRRNGLPRHQKLAQSSCARRNLPTHRSLLMASAAAMTVERLEERWLLSVAKDANGFTVVTPAAGDRMIYVSNSTGNDDGIYTQANPVRTLAQAKSLVRDGS